MIMNKIKVTIWNEFRHEKTEDEVKALYPEGIHAFIAKNFAVDAPEFEVTLACLDDYECGLTDEVLQNTDVLMWWGHMFHGDVPDHIVDKVVDRVFRFGMGFIALHSAHISKPFQRLVGTNGHLSWGENQQELMWNVMPSHPIASGIPEHFELECEEMYGEPFHIPQPDELVFISWYKHGNVFRGGCCFNRGLGKVFYFQPGHETCRSFYDPNVRKILVNAVRWAAPCDIIIPTPNCGFREKIIK